MEFLLVIVLFAVVSGGIIGALGRLALPGPDPMGVGQTILVGIGGSLLAGIVVGFLFGGEAEAGMVASVLGATFIVWMVRRRRERRTGVG